MINDRDALFAKMPLNGNRKILAAHILQSDPQTG